VSSSADRPQLSKFVVKPLTPARWRDLERLFGPRGACGGCWCMYWRETHAEFERRKGEGNKRAMRRIVSSGEVPGIIGYLGGEPVAWCSIAPRERFPRLERSRILKRIDEEPVWSVVCFYIAKPYRRLGLSLRMLEEAVLYAAGKRAAIVEGYPVEPKTGITADVFAYTGLARVFRAAGFTEVTRRSETRPIMRRRTRGASSKKRGGRG
jgi:GNAT superfamily N-acetyltransferase